MTPLRTSLSRVPGEGTSAEEIEAMRQQAWQQRGFIAVRPEEIQDDWLRQGLVALANRLWGKRFNGKG